MYLTHKFKMSHQELINYIKLYLASCGITEYDCYENSYDEAESYFKKHFGYDEWLKSCNDLGHKAYYEIINEPKINPIINQTIYQIIISL